jgi:glycosyltransferase involved in cell wall biosynthesis
MISKPLLSILTPAFNSAEYIRETINSVLSQTYKDWEWTILDDGSTDGTGEIIRSFKDNRIKYIFQEHKGIDRLTKTYNKALSLCNGDFIAFLDHDDYWPQYKLQMQIESLQVPAIVLSYGECCVVNQEGKKIGYIGIPVDRNIACNNPVGSSLRRLLYERDCFISNSTVIVKKSALLNIGGLVEAKGLFHDFPTWVRLSLEGRFAALPCCLGYLRRHPSSTYLNTDPEALFDAGINYLRTFVPRSEKKLNKLDLFYDTEMLEKHWEEIRTSYLRALPYNRAMLMLKRGSFREARAEFKKLLEKEHSVKNALMFVLVILSELVKYDLVNPVAASKGKWAELAISRKVARLLGADDNLSRQFAKTSKKNDRRHKPVL